MVEEKRLKLVYKGMYYKGISINTSPTMLAEYMKKSARNFIFLKPNDGGHSLHLLQLKYGK